MDEINPIRLSKSTAQSIEWEAIERLLDSTRATAHRGDDVPQQFQGKDLEVLRANADLLLATTVSAFEQKLRPLRKKVSLALWIVMPFAALATAAGGFFSGTSTGYAYLLSGGGLLTLLSTVRYCWKMGKDQALLELFPHTYRTLFSLCRSTEQYDSALESFSQELLRLRQSLIE